MVVLLGGSISLGCGGWRKGKAYTRDELMKPQAPTKQFTAVLVSDMLRKVGMIPAVKNMAQETNLH